MTPNGDERPGAAAVVPFEAIAATRGVTGSGEGDGEGKLFVVGVDKVGMAFSSATTATGAGGATLVLLDPAAAVLAETFVAAEDSAATDLKPSLLACFLGTQLRGRGCCAGSRTAPFAFSCLAVEVAGAEGLTGDGATFVAGSNAENRLDTKPAVPTTPADEAVVGDDGDAALADDPAVSAKNDARLAAIEPALDTPGDDDVPLADSAMLRSCAALQLAIRPSSAGERPIAVESCRGKLDVGVVGVASNLARIRSIDLLGLWPGRDDILAAVPEDEDEA